MKSRKLWLGAAAIALVCAAFVGRSIRQRVVWQQRISYLRQISADGGSDAALAALFLNPTKVEAYRMQPIRHPGLAATIGKIDEFDYSAKRTGLSRDFASRVGGLILAPATLTGAAKACAFNPTVGFRVAQGSKWANAVICLGCSQLMVVEPQAPMNSMGAANARFRIAGEFDSYRAEFLALAKEAFPSDITLK